MTIGSDSLDPPSPSSPEISNEQPLSIHAPAAAARADDDSIMSPEASPWRTKNINRRPLVVLVVASASLVCLLGYAFLSRYAESNADSAPRAPATDTPNLPRGTDSKRMADDIIGTPHIGLIPDALVAPATPLPAPPPPPEPKVAITSVIDEPPRPPPRAQPEGPSAATKASQAEEEELRQARVAALREALVAPRTVRFDRRTSGEAQGGQEFVQRELARVAQQRAALGGPTDPATAYREAAAQAAQLLGPQHPGAAQAMPVGMGGGMPGAPGTAYGAGPPPVSRDSLRSFGTRGNERWLLPNEVEDPVSPYMLQAGDLMNAVLDSAVNSDLPGPLIAHLAAPLYSSTGNHELLAPQGTGLFGVYSADVVFGQERLLVAWQRLRFPDGRTLDIGAMPGTDGVGRAGFADEVNHHYLRIFSSALLLSLVTTGVTMTQTPSSSGSDRVSAGAAMSQALGLQFGQVTAQMLQKNLNIAPTIEIRNGFRFAIVCTKDLDFRRPYTER